MRVDGGSSYYSGFGVQTSEGERVRSVMWLDTDAGLYYQAAEPFQVHRSGHIAGALFQVDRIEIDGGRNVFVLHGEHRRVQAGDLEYESWFPIAAPMRIPSCGAKPPGWTAYMETLRGLGERGHLGVIASAELVKAGKALGVAAFDEGADAMHAVAVETARGMDCAHRCGVGHEVAAAMPRASCAAPAPCTPGRHCERSSRGLGACVAGHCNPPAPESTSSLPAAAGPAGELGRIEALQASLRIREPTCRAPTVCQPIQEGQQ